MDFNRSTFDHKSSSIEDNNMILEKFDPFVNRLLSSGTIISIIGIVTVLISKAYIGYAVIDSVLALLLGVLYLRKEKHSTKMKLLTIIALIFIYGFVAFQDQGILGSGIFLSVTAVILSLVFVDRRISYIIISVAVIHGATVLYFVATGKRNYVPESESAVFTSAYLLIYIGVILVVVTAVLTINAIKDHLISNINMLNEQMEVLNEKNEKIQQRAYYDDLTALPNRSYFEMKVNESIKKDVHGTLVLIDLIQFNKVNAFYGWQRGDRLLKEVAQLLSKHLKRAKTIGYLGGNTMGIWVDYPMDEDNLKELFKKYRKEVRKGTDIDIDLDAYVVAVAKSDYDQTFETIYYIAEKTLKYVKRSGDKKIAFLDKDYYNRIQAFELKKDIVEEAILNKSFEVYYQEKVDSRSRKVLGLEALARLTFEGDFISPTEFIPIVEENNRAVPFGKVILEKVLQNMESIIKKYHTDVVVSVNVSPQQLGDPLFIDELKHLSAKWDVSPENIELEITENILMSDIDKIKELFVKIKSYGFKISIDDFGTGYSSLKYIADLPIDVIKIDKSFTDKITTSSKTRAIVKAIVSIAHDTGIKVVAEGVEDKDQIEMLNSLDCYIIQGYYYSKPSPID